MSTIVGKGIVAGGGGGELNVFVQETQPTAQNGLWIKRAKDAVTGVEIDNQLKAADGNNLNLPGSWSEQGFTMDSTVPVAAIKIGSFIYFFGPTSYDQQLKYDIETGIYTDPNIFSPSSYPAITGSYANTVKDGILYSLWKRPSDGYLYIMAIDPVNGTFDFLTKTTMAPTGNAQSLDIFGDEAYFFVQYTNSYVYLYKQDTLQKELGVISKVADFTIPKGHRFTNARGKIFKISNVLYVFQGCLFIGKYDLETGITTTVDQVLQTNPQYYAINPMFGYFQVGNLIYLIGVSTKGTSSNPYIADGVIIFDITTNISTVHEGVLTDEFTRSQLPNACSTWDGADSYLIGGTYNPNPASTSNTKITTIIKYSLKSNDLPNGTVWAHESTSENMTEMYKDKTMTLNLGIDKVLIQEADGLKVQPAAIIKNGVATDIN